MVTTAGRGFVRVDNASSYPDLQSPFHLPENSFDGYSIASLHQYHCIYMIMHSYGSSRFRKESEDTDMGRHVTHCFDYLRQSVLCAGDSALEGESEIVKGMTDGWGVSHMCRKRSEWMDWVVEKRFSDRTGIS